MNWFSFTIGFLAGSVISILLFNAFIIWWISKDNSNQK